MQGRPPYAIVTGQGRSGTTWLLSLFDFSRGTFCRNEPYGISGSPLKSVAHHRRVVRQDQAEIRATWDAAIDQTSRVMGERDLPMEVLKPFIHGVSKSLKFDRLIQKRGARRALSAVQHSLSTGEWPVPWWLGSQSRLSTVLPVVKLVAAPGWVSLVLRHRPDVAVFHVVRHPGGFLNSWRARYLSANDPAEVRSLNRDRLAEIASIDEAWAERFGDVDQMSVEESELWYWRYANEVIWDAGRASPNYRRIVYEDLVLDPVDILREYYEICGLQWDEGIERNIRASSSQSVSIASAWRKKLSAEHRELVSTVLESNPEFYPAEADSDRGSPVS